MNWLIDIDKQIFTTINSGWANSFFDSVLPFLRESRNWVPLYIILLYLSFKKYGWKTTVSFLILVVITVVIGDSVITETVKYSVKRLRPCFDPELANSVIIRVGCGGKYGFFSAHAVNHFAMAYIFQKWFPHRYSYLWYIWAFLIIFSQIYVAKHFPLDVTCGALVGLLLGYLGIKYLLPFLNKILKAEPYDQKLNN